MPITAWYFLNKGSVLRKNAMEELKAKDVIDAFETPTENDLIVNTNFLKGRRWLVAILGNGPRRADNAQNILNLYNQSKEEFKPNILCITGLLQGESMPQMTQQLKLRSTDSTWLNCYLAENHVHPYTYEVFNIPLEFKNKACAVLVDEKLHVRNYFNLDDPASVKELVWQYPVFLSLKK
ncbi:MAG: hypothetical protein HOP11_01810 [Saprospiraceae bacterium]|nr:hypothetical protein [Saprospiraceae bacterium]